MSDAPTPPPNPWREALLLGVVAVAVRVGAAWLLGEGAPFGPDGTGALASVWLGGHPYPLHTALLTLTHDARLLSILMGSATAVLVWAWGRRVGLGGGGGWLVALLPGAVYTGALSAGDAPALALVTLGALLTTARGGLQVVGGALAMASIAVKPIALPALVLLLVRPLSLLGVVLALPVALRWLGPLVSPMPRGGLLGSWWVASDGAPPSDAAGWLALVRGGAEAVVSAPLWACTGLAVVAVVGALVPWRGDPEVSWWTRLGVVGALAGLVATAALFGDRVEPRYLVPGLVALAPWAGAVLPRGVALALLWPTLAVVTQVAAERAERDPSAVVPAVPVVSAPAVDARQLFDEASTDDATALRAEASRLAETLPQGATVTVEHRAHDREGELTWPLQVLRPDVRIDVVQP